MLRVCGGLIVPVRRLYMRCCRFVLCANVMAVVNLLARFLTN